MADIKPLGAGETPFDDWTVDDAKKRIEDAKSDDAEEIRTYYEGDHWNGGDGWVGPRPGEEDEDADAVMTLIEEGFTSRNVIAEVVERHTRGVVGREPAWALVPREALEDDEALEEDEEAPQTEIEAWVTAWWNERRVHSIMQSVCDTMLLEQRGVVRLYVPAGLLSEGGTIDAPDIPTALRMIYIEELPPDQATVYEDPDTKRAIGIYAYKTEDGKDVVELVYSGPFDPLDPETAEVETILRTIGDAGDEEYPQLFGGKLTMFEVKRKTFITQQVMQNQRALNLALSVIPRTVVTSGFLERIITNAQMPGEWVNDANGDKSHFVPLPLKVGAGTTNFVRGLEIEDQRTTGDVKTTLTTPGVHFKDPTPIDAAADAHEKHYEVILNETDQAHVLTIKSGEPSGKSRQEARSDYEGSLNESANLMRDLGRWLIETVVAMAEGFAGTPGQFTTDFRGDFTCFVDTGPVDFEEMRVSTELVDKGMISRETGMSRVGIDDVDAELVRLNTQPGAALDLKKRQLEVMQLAVTAGLDHEVAATLAGFSDKEIALIKKVSEAVKAEEEVVRQEELAAKTKNKPPVAAA